MGVQSILSLQMQPTESSALDGKIAFKNCSPRSSERTILCMTNMRDRNMLAAIAGTTIGQAHVLYGSDRQMAQRLDLSKRSTLAVSTSKSC